MSGQKFKVLVVDNDVLLRDLAAVFLYEEYEVMEAVDGQDAWEKAQAWHPDLVVTDLMMPRMHGYELCTLLKGPDGIKGVRIIVLSSKTFATDKEQAFKAGCDAYLVKPYTRDILLKKVRELLSGSDSRETPAAGPAPFAEECGPEPSSTPALAGREKLPVTVRFWGTRGSCPVSGQNPVRYGGNTPCTEVRIGDLLLIIDCGTGLRELGVSMAKEFYDRPITGHIFVGHTHWDHIQGFPFFIPLYNPKNNFSVYSVHGGHGSLRSIFNETMAADYFPVPLCNMAAKLRFIEMSGSVDLGLAKVSFIHLNHPGICIGFRIDAQGRSITYISDHENFVKLNGDNVTSRRQDMDIVNFAKDSDILIMEAQYSNEEYLSRKGWGHGTFDDAVRCAVEAGAKRLAITHHDPEHSDDIMDTHIKYSRALAGSKLDCFAARDGLRVEL